MIWETHSFKTFYSFYLVITLQNLKVLLSLLLLSQPTILKFYKLATSSFFGLVIKLIFLGGIGRNYVSIMIFILSNITVLLSQTAICFEYFMSMNNGVNRKAPIFVSTTSPPPLPPIQENIITSCCCFFVLRGN